jgi:hypothetical protein
MSIDDVGTYDGGDGRSAETGRASFTTIQLTLVRMESLISGLRQDIQYMREAQTTRATDNERRFNDQEMRLRNIEAKRYLEPKSVTTVFAIMLPIIAIGVSIIAIIVK